MVRQGEGLPLGGDRPCAFPVASDSTGAVGAAFGLSPDPARASCMSVLFGPNLKVFEILHVDAAEQFAAHVEQVVDKLTAYLGKDPSRLIIRQAPVLLIDQVFDRDFCRHLIDVWETQGNDDSGFMRQIDGRTVGMLDYGHKRRRDHFLGEGETKNRIKRFVGQRVVPEIRRAYQFEVTRFEDFRIVCYDASVGGYFRPHRDNTTDGTAHRRFAMTLNLNAEEYTGGELRFPEFGPHRYRPETGQAVIFSCSLLHEALDVTEGRRFALLSFLYGEEDARRREQYERRAAST